MVLILDKIVTLIMSFVLYFQYTSIFLLVSIVILIVLLDLLLFINCKFKLLLKANINNLLDNVIVIIFLVDN